jgi:predicted metal-dependent hydrolase
MNPWPPEFSLRKSKRAKRPSIRISLYQKVEVVIPERMKFFDPLALLNEHKTWVLAQLSKVVPQRGFFPSSITFPALDRHYDLMYQPTDSTRLHCRIKDTFLIFSGDISSWPKVQRRLIQWLNKEAAVLLLPHVVFLAQQHGFTINTLHTRHMKTRWGICRNNGSITLNSQLLFLPLPLIHHVILHELCHTRYMSHGPRFWGLLNKVDPNTGIHDKALSNVQEFLPGWL